MVVLVAASSDRITATAFVARVLSVGTKQANRCCGIDAPRSRGSPEACSPLSLVVARAGVLLVGTSFEASTSTSERRIVRVVPDHRRPDCVVYQQGMI